MRESYDLRKRWGRERLWRDIRYIPTFWSGPINGLRHFKRFTLRAVMYDTFGRGNPL